MQILPNMSRSKEVKATRHWNLLNWQNIKWEPFFLKNHTQNMMQKLFPDLFMKNQNWDQQSTASYSLFLLCVKLSAIEMLKLSYRPLAFTSCKAFLKEVWKLSPCLIICMVFEGKYFFCYVLLTDQISLSGCFYFMRYWAICVLHLFVNQVVTS